MYKQIFKNKDNISYYRIGKRCNSVLNIYYEIDN